MSAIRSALDGFSKVLPEIRKPGRKVSLTEKLAWTALALVIYVWMGHTFLYGLPPVPPTQRSPVLLNVVFAQRTGTLVTLGIGPIVTAGLILQLLVGAELIKLNLSKTEDRALFTAASKLFSIVITVFQAAAFVLAGTFGQVNTTQAALIFVQLVIATVVIILLDELVQKGWGLGSGISLFIAAGVAETIFVNLFSPIQLPDGFLQGIVPALVQGLSGAGLEPLIVRSTGFPDVLGLAATAALILFLIYLEAVRIEIPISYARFAGYRATYPIKLLYVSNVPVIFATTVFSNIYYIGSIVWSRFNPNNSDTLLNLIGTFTSHPQAAQPIPTSGLAYYVIGPNGLGQVLQDPVRAGIYALLLIGFCVVFARFWVQIGGLGPDKVAEQLVSAGMQIPGFRRSPEVIARVVSKYISTVTILGALIVGVIASVADYLNVYGSGTGLLLMTGILMQYYQMLAKEKLTEMYPAVGKMLGEE